MNNEEQQPRNDAGNGQQPNNAGNGQQNNHGNEVENLALACGCPAEEARGIAASIHWLRIFQGERREELLASVGASMQELRFLDDERRQALLDSIRNDFDSRLDALLEEENTEEFQLLQDLIRLHSREGN